MNQEFYIFVSLFIAFISILLTAFILYENYKHNRLSVKPIPDLFASNFVNRITVSLENKGIGPYIIKSFRVIKGNEIKSNIIEWMPVLPDGIYYSNFLKDFEGTAVKPSESIILFEFILKSSDERQLVLLDTIRNILSEIGIEFDYTDIYERKMTFPLHFLSNVYRIEDNTKYISSR